MLGSHVHKDDHQHIKPKELRLDLGAKSTSAQFISLLGPAVINLLPLPAVPSTLQLPDVSPVDDDKVFDVTSFFFLRVRGGRHKGYNFISFPR